MQENKITISHQLMWILIVISFSISLVSFYLNMQEINFPKLITYFNFGFFFVLWLILLVEMISHKIYNQTFWVMSMFILPPFTVLFYMIQRQRLKRLASNFTTPKKSELS